MNPTVVRGFNAGGTSVATGGSGSGSGACSGFGSGSTCSVCVSGCGRGSDSGSRALYSQRVVVDDELETDAVSTTGWIRADAAAIDN